MRLKQLGLVFALLFAFLLTGLASLQLIHGSYYAALSEQNRIRSLRLRAPRGRILDRRGALIVGNRAARHCALVPQECEDVQATLTRVAFVLRRSAPVLQATFQRGRSAPFVPVVIARDLSSPELATLEELRDELVGVLVITEPTREYRAPEATAHVVGVLGEIDREHLTRLRPYGYKMKDLIGKSGVEAAYDAYLRGRDGGTQVEVDHRSRQRRVLGSIAPQPGQDVVLTIDLRLQARAAELLGRHRGAIIVSDPFTGEILAMVSAPTFHPGVFLDDNEGDARLRLLTHRSRPLLNRAIAAEVVPGSVLKIVTALSIFPVSMVNLKERYGANCRGSMIVGDKTFHCWRLSGHGWQDLPGALAHSCNVFFYTAGLKVGVDGLHRMASAMGFGRRTGIELPGERAGLIPSRRWKRQHRGEPWYEGDTANFAIGQGDWMVTPLQVHQMISVVATGGLQAQPFVVKQVGAIELQSPKGRRVELPVEGLGLIREGLRRVVHHAEGTGRRASRAAVPLAGKTGTAQTGRDPHAWFAAYAPADQPRYGLTIFLEHGGRGSERPAEIAVQLVNTMKELGYW